MLGYETVLLVLPPETRSTPMQTCGLEAHHGFPLHAQSVQRVEIRQQGNLQRPRLQVGRIRLHHLVQPRLMPL